MKIIYLKNFRKGFATNSSSTHSLIYKNKDDMFKDLNIFELNYYDRFDRTIAVTREAKIKYICSQIFYNKFLFEVMCKYYPEMEQYISLIKKQKEEYAKKYNDPTRNTCVFGSYTRGEIILRNNENLEFNIQHLKDIIENDEIIIVGGSDEEGWVYEVCEGHKEVPDISDINKKYNVVKNGNYWIAINHWNGNRIRFNTSNEECIPQYPELIDLKITNQCEHGCPFCYMGSNLNGKHADLSFLKRIISQVSSNEYDGYKKRVEFAIGGGNILLYPHLNELFNFIKEKGHIISTTINAKDIIKIYEDQNLKTLFNNYVNSIGISISELSDIDILAKYDINKELKNCKCTLHLIPEMLGIELTRLILEQAYKLNYYNKLFLGYKTNNRGASQNHVKFTNEDLNKLFEDLYSVGIDTTFTNTYKDWVIKNYDTKNTITWNEGEYSMYIDGVEENAYKSSYQLDKPYNLTINWEEKNVNPWYDVIQAFNNIRNDNGFKIDYENI